MKYKLIKKPRLVGCLNRSPVPPAILPKTKPVTTYGWVTLKCNGKFVQSWTDEETPSPKVIERMFAREIAEAERVTLEIETYMHYEVYELNKDDGEWYLVEQGIPD